MNEDAHSTIVKSLSLAAAVVSVLFSMIGSFNAQGEDVIRIETELVSFEVVVTDKNGKPVRGLEAKDFTLFEDENRKNIDFFQPIINSQKSRPLSIVFAIDVSGSITPDEIIKLRNSMHTFIEKLGDYNSHFAVTTFGMNVKKIQSFTNQPKKLTKSLEKVSREPNGLSTHAYDAADYGIRMLKKDSPKAVGSKIPKRVIILITDGFPVGDTVAPSTVIERANVAETSVYAIILPSYSRMEKGKKPVTTLLEASGLIEKTGGRSFYAAPQEFAKLFESLAEEITSSYVLAFYPKRENRDPGIFRRVKIEGPGGFTIKQNRSGYKLKSQDDQ